MRRVALIFAVLACGCSRRVAVTDDGRPAGSAAAPALRLADDVLAAAHIKTEPAKTERLAATLDMVGEVAADPDRVANIASPVAGRLESVTLELGAEIKQGQAVAVVLAPELGHARAESVTKHAQATMARTNAVRMQGLHDTGIESQKTADTARVEAETLEAEALAATGRLGALGAGKNGDVASSALVLRAPIAGRVIARNAVVGQPVTADQILGTIARLDQMWFVARVYERDLARVKIGAAVDVRLNAYPDRSFRGSIAYIDQLVDPAARTITARVRLDNADNRLRIGLFGTARMTSDADTAMPAAIVVPRSAIVEIGGRSVVFVRGGDGAFVVRGVTTGASAQDRISIASGLREGELVVVDGAFTLRSIVLRGTLEAD